MALSSETISDMIEARLGGAKSYTLPNGVSVTLEDIAALERALERAKNREGAEIVPQQAAFL